MSSQKLSNLFKLRMYDVLEIMQYCIENDINLVINDLSPEKETYQVKDLPNNWKILLTFKPYNKYSK